MDDRSGGRREQRNRLRQERQPPFARCRKGPLCLEPPLELFEARAQLADIVVLDLVGDEAQTPGLAEEIDAAAEHENLAVLGQRGHPSGVVGEQHGLKLADAVPDRYGR